MKGRMFRETFAKVLHSPLEQERLKELVRVNQRKGLQRGGAVQGVVFGVEDSTEPSPSPPGGDSWLSEEKKKTFGKVELSRAELAQAEESLNKAKGVFADRAQRKKVIRAEQARIEAQVAGQVEEKAKRARGLLAAE
jgi:hypothetical protein